MSSGAAGGEQRGDAVAATPVPASLCLLLLKVAHDPNYVRRMAAVTSAFLYAGQGSLHAWPPEEWMAPASFKVPVVWKIKICRRTQKQPRVMAMSSLLVVAYFLFSPWPVGQVAFL